jgi:hypothetical protein
MRLFCKEDHDDQMCPSGPVHDFSGEGWTAMENGVGCLWCVRCGDIRQVMPVSISASELEVITVESDAA